MIVAGQVVDPALRAGVDGRDAGILVGHGQGRLDPGLGLGAIVRLDGLDSEKRLQDQEPAHILSFCSAYEWSRTFRDAQSLCHTTWALQSASETAVSGLN